MVERYLLKADWQTSWQTVSKEEWIRAERSAGFRPKVSSDDPRYMQICATAGFSGNGVSGKIGSAAYITGDLITDLWWFIENVTDDDPTRQDQFFALRERVRSQDLEKVTLTLNIFDEDGVVVDTAPARLTIAQITDIVDHAAQLILLQRDDKPVGSVLAELEEALAVSNVIEQEV